jgi:Domain of unknown function (DUF4276)
VRRPKVGLIFECGPDGPDQQVCEYLARRLEPALDLSSVALGNKPRLLAECGRAAARLLEEGCERVVIVWDLYPPWRERGARPCRREDRRQITEALEAAGITARPVFLVCIREELEAWLLADERALMHVLSRPAHPAKVRGEKRPEQVRDPKKRLMRHFERHGQRYNLTLHARKIVEALPDWSRIRRCESFLRFALKVTGRPLQ